MLVLREKVYQDNEAEVRQRWSFEDAVSFSYLLLFLRFLFRHFFQKGHDQDTLLIFSFVFSLQIKRPYFHVKPLDRLQLRAWHSYLDWEIAQLNKGTKEQSTEGDYTCGGWSL